MMSLLSVVSSLRLFDICSNVILIAELQTRNATVFHKSNMSVNGLALGGHRIYWTCYDARTLKGSIMSRSTGGKSETAQVVATNLYQPRALAVDINSNGQVNCAARVPCPSRLLNMFIY